MHSHERLLVAYVFKSPPPVGAGGGYMFSGRPSVRACVLTVEPGPLRACYAIDWIIVLATEFRDA